MEVGLRVTPFNRMMRKARHKLGLTQAQLAELVGCRQNTISAIEILRSPVNEEMANKIALVLGCDVDYLFPPESRNFKSVKNRSVEFVMEIEDIDSLPISEFPVLVLPSLEDSYIRRETKDRFEEAITGALESLSVKEQQILELRFGLNGEEPCTLEETGCILGVNRERIRQIEGKALRRLKHPKYSRPLRGFLEEGATA